MNFFELVGRLVLDKSEYEEGLNDAEKETSGFTDKLKSGLGTATKLAGGAIVAGGAVVTAVAKQATDAYGNFEQLSGGIETLFGESADIVLKNAEKAYQSASMSTNDYLETVMQFSSSLIQSAGRGAQTDLDELEAQLDEEYKVTKRGLEDELEERKEYWKHTLETAKKNKYPYLEELKQRRDDELKEMKRANEDKLAELKQHNKEVLEETERANLVSVKTPESLQRSAELADMALQDMSDNANKMGTNMQSIQNAYSGFAKQNYTMLDNLKLGYGGTKDEMQRLLKDAEALTGKKFDVSSYADIVEAIHAIQVEMNITGTTSQEAMDTLQGSMGMAKASWDNLVAGFANPDADLGQLVDNFVNSATGALNNMIPIVVRAISGIGQALPSVVKAITDVLPQLITELLPPLIESAVTLVEGLVEAIPKIISGISDLLPTLIPLLIEGMINIFMAIINNLDLLVDSFVQLMIGITEGIINALPVLIEKLPEILMKIGEALIRNIPVLLEAIVRLVIIIGQAVWDLLSTGAQKLAEWFSGVWDSIVEWFKNLPNTIAYWLGYAIGVAGAFLRDLPAMLKDLFIKMINKVVEFGQNFKERALESARNFKESLINGIRELPERIKDIGRNIVDGLKNGILEKWENLKQWFSNLGKGLLDGWKNAFATHSPSKKTEEIGKWLAQGFGIGFENEFVDVKKNMENVSLDMDVTGGLRGGMVVEEQNADKQIADLLRAILYKIPDATDPDSIFRIVRRTNEEFKEATGVSAFV